MNYLECYMSKTFFKDALTVTIGGEDLLKKSVQGMRLYMNNTQLSQWGVGDTRHFYLKVDYVFNAMRNKYKGDSGVDEVIRRM